MLALILLLSTADARSPSPAVQALTEAEAAEDVLAAADALSPRDLRRHPDDIEHAIRKLALLSHQAGRSGEPDQLLIAEEAYSRYFIHFADHENAYKMYFGHGELLYKLKRYDEAFVEYRRVVAMAPGGEHTKFCANSAIYAAQLMSQADPGASRERGSADPIALSEWDQKYLDALEQYAAMYPDDAEAQKTIYKAGYLLYQHNRFDEAETRFMAAIARSPSTRNAEQAANLILDALVIREDWVGLQTTVTQLIAQEDLGSDRFKAELTEIQERVEEKLSEE